MPTAAFKLRGASVGEQTVGNIQPQCSSLGINIRERLLGHANEATVTLENTKCTALLDSGSQVSTISQAFYEQHLRHRVPLHSLDEVLKIECADGQLLPYLGYVEAKVNFPGVNVGDLVAVLLVCPLTEYSRQVPVLVVGANILRLVMDRCREREGTQFLQVMKLATPWHLALHGLGTGTYGGVEGDWLGSNVQRPRP